MQSENISLMVVNLSTFHLDISIVTKQELLENIANIFVILFVFNLEISGNEYNNIYP